MVALFPKTLVGWSDYIFYAAGIVVGYGILNPLFTSIEDGLRKKEA